MEVLHYLAQAPNWLASKFTRSTLPSPVDVESELVKIRFDVAELMAFEVERQQYFQELGEVISMLMREVAMLENRIALVEIYSGMPSPDDDTPKPAEIPAPEKPKLQLVYDHNTHSVVRDVDKPLSPALQVGTAIAAQALMESNARQNAKPDEVLPVA